VILLDLLGIGLTIASSAIAVVPDKPYEFPFARGLAKAIAVIGMVLAFVAIVCGCRCFYRRQVSRIGLIACMVICILLAALHFINSLTFGGTLYVGAALLFSIMFVVDQRIVSSATNRLQNLPMKPNGEVRQLKIDD